jgi:hypothetical protein
MVEGNDPFVEFGGKTTTATTVSGDDPFAEFGGKKKVPTTPDSSLGGENSSVGSEKTQPTSGSGDSRAKNPRIAFLEDVVQRVAPNAPKRKEGQSLADYGTELNNYGAKAKGAKLVDFSPPQPAKPAKDQFVDFVDEEIANFPKIADGKTIADVPEEDANLYIYKEYLKANDPEKLKRFEDKLNYKSVLPYALDKLDPAEREKIKAEFYDEALQVKQQYLNIKMEKLMQAANSEPIKELTSTTDGLTMQIESLNQAYQSGNLDEANYKSGYEDLTAKYNEVQSQLEPLRAEMNTLSQAWDKNVSEAQEWVNRYPLEAKRRLEEKANQERNDIIYEMNPTRRVAAKVSYQLGQAVTNFVAKSLAIPQITEGVIDATSPLAAGVDRGYNWKDRLADTAADLADEINKDYFPAPTKFDKSLVGRDEKGDIKMAENFGELLVPKTVRTLADMGIMMGGGFTGLGEKAGTVTSSFMLTAKDYYDEGIKAGMSEKAASAFSIPMGMTQGLLELVDPEAVLAQKQLAKMTAEKAAGLLTSKMGMKEVVKESAKYIGKNIAAENAQEISQMLGERIGRYAAIQVTDADLDLGDWQTESLETVMLTTVVSGLSGGGLSGAKNNRSELEKRALYSSVVNPEVLLDATKKAVGEGKLTEPEALQINSAVANLKLNLDALPEDIAESEKVQIVSGLFDKMKLLQSVDSEKLDPAVAKVYTDRIASIDKGIAKITSKYIDNESTSPQTIEELSVEEPVVAPVEEVVATEPTPQTDVVDSPPTYEQKLKDIKEGKTVSFVYSKESDIPQELKDKVSSTSEINGKKEFKVTISKSEADYLVSQKNKPTETPAKVPKPIDPVANESAVTVTGETLPDLGRDELIGIIADGTAKELVDKGEIQLLPFMELVEKYQLPLPKLVSEYEGDNTVEEQGTRTDEEDLRLGELINKAQERSGINNLNLVDENTLPPTAEGTQEAITTNTNEQEVNQKGQRREELLSPTESAKTEPVSEVEAQKINLDTQEKRLTYLKQYLPKLFDSLETTGQIANSVQFIKEHILKDKKLSNTKELQKVAEDWLNEYKYPKKPTTEQRIETANKRIDTAAQALKDILKVNVVPNAKKSGFDTEAIIDLIVQATKQLVNKGIKTQVALEQAINTLRDAGVISGKEITKMRNIALSMVDEESDKVWVTKNGKYELYRNTFGDFEVRDEKGKPVTKRSIRKNVISEFTKGKDLTKGKLANLEGIQEKDASRFIADNSENPMQVAQAMAYTANQMDENSLDYKEQIIAEHLPMILRSSFVNENDESNLIDEEGKFKEGTSIQVNYLRANGLPLDKAAEAINSGAGQEGDFVTEQDIINFILKYPKGKSNFYSQTNPDYLALQNKFYELTGFNATPEILEQAKDYAETEEDFAGLEPVEKEGADEMSEPEKKKRAFSKNYMASEDISGETKALAKKDAIYYLQQSNMMSVAEANKVIADVGIDVAESIAKDFNNKINGGVRSVLLQRIIKMHEDAGNSERADVLFEFATDAFTNAGQFIQAAYLWGKLTPEGQVRMAQKAVEKDRIKREKIDKPVIDKTKKAVRDAVKEAVDEALVSTGVQTAAEQGADIVEEKTYGSKNKGITKERYKKALAKLKASGFRLSSNPIPEGLTEILAYHAEASGREFAKFSRRVIKDLGVAVKPRLRELYEKAKQKAIENGVDESIFATAEEISKYYADKQIEKIEGTVRKGLKELDKKLADIVKSHYTEYNATKAELVDKLIDESDLEPDDAKRLADAIKKEFDRIFKEKRKKILDGIVKEKPTIAKEIKRIDKLSEDLLKLVNLGGFSDAEFLVAWAKANGYPELTEENINEIKRLANIVQSFKDEGFEKFRAIEDLLAYQAKIKNITKWDIAQALWYASLLSGFQTQFVNATSTAINSLFEYLVQARRNPRSAGFLAKGWWNGFMHGFLNEAPEVWRSGYNPIRGKVEIPATLEIVGKDKGKLHIYNIAKMVRRMMIASDVIFYEGLREMKAYQLAVSMATEEHKTDPSIKIRNRALEILNLDDASFKDAKNLALKEYENKVKSINDSRIPTVDKNRLLKQAERDQVRRVHELIQNERDVEKTEEARRFAAKGTFNYPPEGALGLVSRAINVYTKGHPAARYLVPFTNIIANVANETLNYTPYGALRATIGKNKGGHLTASRDTPLTNEERADLLTKAVIGTLFMTTVMMLSGRGDDDEDPILEITGGGTGDYKKNFNLKDWKQYSFRVKLPSGGYSNWISYQNTPLMLGFAYVGNLRDLEKYRGVKMNEDTFMKYRKALSNTKTVFLDMTFLASINTFLGDLFTTQNVDYTEKGIKLLTNIAKPFVDPNIYAQSFKQIQEWFDIPIKETTFMIDRPETWAAVALKDMPVARNVYYDKIDALGDPIIPNPDKFIKDDKDIPDAWKMVTKYKMTNLSVPSIKIMTEIDPLSIKDKKKGIQESVYTFEEYYHFSQLRGGYIKFMLRPNLTEDSATPAKWDAMNKVKAGSGDDAAREWMTATMKEATKRAKEVIFNERMANFK